MLRQFRLQSSRRLLLVPCLVGCPAIDGERACAIPLFLCQATHNVDTHEAWARR